MSAKATFSRSELTLYLIDRVGGSGGGEPRLALGSDAAEREAQEVGHGHADVVTVSPLEWHEAIETAVLFMADDVDAVLADVFAFADRLGLDYEPGRCDTYALLLAVRDLACA